MGFLERKARTKGKNAAVKEAVHLGWETMVRVRSDIAAKNALNLLKSASMKIYLLEREVELLKLQLDEALERK